MNRGAEQYAPGGDLNKRARWQILWGIVDISSGIITIGLGLADAAGATLLAGIVLVGWGAMAIIEGFEAGPFDRMVRSLGVALLILGGALLLVRPVTQLAPVPMLLIAYFLVTGVWVIHVALRVEPNTVRRWGLVEGIGTVLLGVLLGALWPVSGVLAIVASVGAYGLLVGLCQVGNAVVTRSQQAQRGPAAR